MTAKISSVLSLAQVVLMIICILNQLLFSFVDRPYYNHSVRHKPIENDQKAELYAMNGIAAVLSRNDECSD
jgi:hypothetical protein